MKEKFKAWSKFKKFFYVYMAALLALMLVLWFLAWNYAAAYEKAQVKGAMNAYMEQIDCKMTDYVAAFSVERANVYQPADQIQENLTEKVLLQEWGYRKHPNYTSASPMYTLYSGSTAIGEVTLKSGDAGVLSFGLVPWEVASEEFWLEQIGETVTVVAPAGQQVMLNGAKVNRAAETVAVYPAFEEYSGAVKYPLELQVYHVDGIYADGIEVACGDLRIVEAEEANTYYAVEHADDSDVEELEKLASNFATAYLKYTSNSNGGGNVFYYVAQGSELQDRLYRSQDGMSWVHYSTGKIVKCEVGEISYFGNAATFDAEYLLDLKSGEMSGNMHVVCVRAQHGWRVADIDLF